MKDDGSFATERAIRAVVFGGGGGGWVLEEAFVLRSGRDGEEKDQEIKARGRKQGRKGERNGRE